MLKADITMETVEGFEPSQPLRMDAKPAQGRGGQKPGGQRKPGNRGHGKPQPRGASPHAGPKQHRGGGRRRRTA